MHSHERAPPPKTPHAAHSVPISAQVPLPIQRFFFVDGALVGHDPGSTHWPLQTTEDASQTHVVGLSGGEAVKPSVHLNAHGFLSTQTGMLWSG
jgi:hypothetical protein